MQTEEKGQRPEAQERMRKLYSNKPINSENIIFITINGSVYIKLPKKSQEPDLNWKLIKSVQICLSLF